MAEKIISTNESGSAGSGRPLKDNNDPSQPGSAGSGRPLKDNNDPSQSGSAGSGRPLKDNNDPSQMAVAEKLLQVQAIKLSVKEPFTWSSGWKSPIYCDNRKVLGFPYIRDFIKSEMCNVIFAQFPGAALLAGVATAGIAWGAMAADQLKLPYIYVRSKPKEHGLGQQIEGYYEKGQPVVVIEDLISTGKSSLQVVEILREAGLEVIGLVSIFNYGFAAGKEAMEKAGVSYVSLSNYPTLIQLALEKKMVSPEEESILLKWSEDPAVWQGV